jgi:protein O-GlcNAc transferase
MPWSFGAGNRSSKYLPQFDQVFASIATLVRNSQFVFVRHYGAEQINALFEERLKRVFAASGLNASEHCRYLPRLSRSQYLAALGKCDVFLDSIGWSGATSILESLSHNLPIVTMSGAFMRGRQSAAILRRMEITETIADTIEGFISIAARVANHPDERHVLSRRIADNKHRIYRDRACIAALEDFLDHSVRRQAI